MLCGFVFCVLYPGIYSYAQEDAQVAALHEKISEAKDATIRYAAFQELSRLYFNANKYAEFVQLIKPWGVQKRMLEPAVNYYIGLARFRQLSYLEEKQDWNEYFGSGDAYRSEMSAALEKAAASTKEAKNIFGLYSRLIFYQLHAAGQDSLRQAALEDLMQYALAYHQGNEDTIPLKESADVLLANGDKAGAKELYTLYVNSVVDSPVGMAGLQKLAMEFYQQGKLELAELLFDKEASPEALVAIAKLFAYKDGAPSDPAYAEQVFAKIGSLHRKELFDEELIYLRGRNLERIKDYALAKDIYVELAKRYPASSHSDEADFKIGIIYTYAMRDLLTGRAYFKRGSAKEEVTPQVISSYYQLGLLSQWEQENKSASEYYNALIAKAKEGFGDTVALAKERLKEIQEDKPIEYNLKVFLDASLKENASIYAPGKIDLKSAAYVAKKDSPVSISAGGYAAVSGCMSVETQYLWSGDLGAKPSAPGESALTTSYQDPGTKVINLVVISPTGVIDRSFDMVDVQ